MKVTFLKNLIQNLNTLLEKDNSQRDQFTQIHPKTLCYIQPEDVKGILIKSNIILTQLINLFIELCIMILDRDFEQDQILTQLPKSQITIIQIITLVTQLSESFLNNPHLLMKKLQLFLDKNLNLVN